MTKKKKAFLLGGRLEWLVLALLLLGALLLWDASRSQGFFQSRSGICPRIGKSLSVRSKGPSTSVTHVQPNFHIVVPGVWRSAQPTPESLKRMKTYGLKTIVNLRRDGERESWEGELAEKLGLQYFRFPLSAREVVPLKTVDAVLSVLSDPARQPVLVHCAAGKDRAGMILAAQRIANTDWSFHDIYQEMMMYGYADTEYPKMLETLRLWSTAQGRPEMAQQIALIEKEVSEKKEPTSI